MWCLLWQCSYFYIHTCHCIWKSPHRIKFRIFRMCARHGVFWIQFALVLSVCVSVAHPLFEIFYVSFVGVSSFLHFISYAIVYACHDGDHPIRKCFFTHRRKPKHIYTHALFPLEFKIFASFSSTLIFAAVACCVYVVRVGRRFAFVLIFFINFRIGTVSLLLLKESADSLQ